MQNVIVTDATLFEVVEKLKFEQVLAVDTETTGYYWSKNDHLFSVIVASKDAAYYFNFNDYQPEQNAPKITDKVTLARLFWQNQSRLWVFQNAKFDLHFLAKEGFLPSGRFYDCMIGGRLIDNIQESYSLDSMAERFLGERKDDKVKEWLIENKCFTLEPVEGRKNPIKLLHFDRVPFDLISSYALKDARLTFDLWYEQMRCLVPSDEAVLDNECQLIETLYLMEERGVKIDHAYVTLASSVEKQKVEAARKEWLELIGSELVDSGESLKPIFEGFGFEIGLTEKGEPNVDHYVIENIDHPSARILERYRDSEKRYQTFMGLLNSCDSEHVVHTDFKQTGTVTGRMSSMNPNLQNLAADDESDFPIRRSFVPRPGFMFVSIDYQQMEFRLLLDYAAELELIEKIKNGFDPHDATAELTGLSRKAAKTLNFGLVYGMGIKKLAKAIGSSEAEAKKFKQQYFARLPGVQNFLYEVRSRMEKRGYTWNWLGRRFQLKDRRLSYRGPNAVIQGGCADICKIAMNRISEFLLNKKSRMVLQVHDEVLLEMAFDELDLLIDVHEIMQKAYPSKYLPLTCSVAYSLKSFHDMVESSSLEDLLSAARESLSSEGPKSPEKARESVVFQG